MSDLKTFTCECHTECLVVTEVTEYDEVEIAFWRYGRGHRETLRNRLRAIWKILRDGHPYSDMVILNRVEAQRLASELRGDDGKKN